MEYNHTIKFPPVVKDIANIFNKNGFELYAVGGAIRDILHQQLISPSFLPIISMDNTLYSDIDFASNATPEEVMQMFPRTIPTGIKHGTVSILFKKNKYEITTYRIENSYSNHRNPDNIKFIKNIKQDLSRRDFTINAIASNPSDGTIIDIFNGIDDLKNKTIKCVGNPTLRFEEDALRMIRAVRFATCLNFTIEKMTIEAIIKKHTEITYISKERICSEFRKILCSKFPQKGIALLTQTHLIQHIIPIHNSSITKHLHYSNPCEKIELNSIKEIFRLAICISMSWHNHETPTLTTSISRIKYNTTILKNLRFPNNIIKQVVSLVSRQHYIRYKKNKNISNIQYSSITIHLTHYKLAYFTSLHGISFTKLLLEFLQYHIIFLQHTHTHNTKFQQEINIILHTLKQSTRLLDDKKFLCTCISMQQLHINGTILAQYLARTPGKWLGYLLSTLHRHVLQYPKDNQKHILLDLAKSKYHVKNL